MRIETFDTVSSTNDSVKRYLEGGENVAVFAAEQTGGRGTKGRSFLSARGGVYGSYLVYPQDLAAENAFRVMAHAATAVVRTAAEFGIVSEIKWANDVLAAGRKLAGILIENGLCGGKVAYSIVGIGLNVQNDVSALGVAVSMAELLSDPPAVSAVRERLIQNFLRPSSFEEYLGSVRFLGRRVRVTEGENVYEATARRILTDGRLEIEAGGIVRALSSAEIAIGPLSGERS